MARPRVLVLRAPGTNCDAETCYAFERAGASAETLHLNRLLELPQSIHDAQVLCIPGGFSYGDDIGAGRIFASSLRRRLGEQLSEFRDKGDLVLGICNGFQALINSGLLHSDDDRGPMATLAWNASGRFVDRWVHLEAVGDRCVFLRGIDRLELPIAHAEGNFTARDAGALAQLDSQQQLPLRYVPRELGDGADTPDSDYNPNGSMGDVAGMCDRSGRVFGLMPHPERFIEPTHHPQWTRRPEITEGAGLRIFQNAVDYFA